MEEMPEMWKGRKSGEGRAQQLWCQRCKCKECGIYYTKRHEHPEETKELAIKIYYGGSQRSRCGKNSWNEQVQCNELDKKALL